MLKRWVFVGIVILALMVGVIQLPSQAYAQTGGEYWAVIVDVVDYQYLSDLGSATNGVDLNRELQPIFGEDNIKLLLDEDATKANIRNAVTDWLDAREDANDTVLFFFSGHGESEYLCPYESLRTSYANDIRSIELATWLDELESQSIAVIIESCYSGSFINELSGSGRVILTSSDVDELSYQSPWLGHSDYSHFIIQAFSDLEAVDANGNHEISAEEIFSYVVPELEAYLLDYPSPTAQNPQIADSHFGELTLFTIGTITFQVPSSMTPIRIDGNTYRSTQLFTWASGTTHDVSVEEEVTLSGGDTRYSFVNWSDGSTALSRTITVSGSVSLTANYRTEYKLIHSLKYFDPERNKWVTSIVDGWHTSGDRPSVSTLSLIRDYGEGSRQRFIGWSGDATGMALSISVMMDSPKTVVANYQLQYELTVVTSPPGLEGITGGDWYDDGSTASIVRASDIISGGDGVQYVFLRWELDNIEKTGRSSMSITMDSPHDVTADFQTRYELTVTTNPPGIEGITGGDWYDARSVASVARTSDTISGGAGVQYVFLRWALDDIKKTGGSSMSVTMDSPHGVTADYQTQYQLIVESVYGEPQGAGWYDAGSAVSISVEPSVGLIIRYVCTGWSGGIDVTSPAATVPMDGPKTVTANWRTDYTRLYILVVVWVVALTSIIILLARRKKKVV